MVDITERFWNHGSVHHTFEKQGEILQVLAPGWRMVQDKFVFSIQDPQVKEWLLREEKLTLEKEISMARASKASKEQIKAMGPKEQNIENLTVN